jgi:ornithine carbamoyltransferase
MHFRPLHLLSLADLQPADFCACIDLAEEIKHRSSRYMRALYEKTLLMIFEAPSLRTRLSFETAMTQLHGHAINYYTVHSPWGAGKESIEDVGRTLSRYCNAVSARIYDHAELVRLAENCSVPVINAMTNNGHPCQILGDLLTVREHLGKGSEMRWAYIGDGCNNVTYSLMRAAAITGNTLRIAAPENPDYLPPVETLVEVQKLCDQFGGQVEVVHDPREAVTDANMVYTDSWMSYRVPAAEKERRLRDLAAFTVDGALMRRAAKDAVFMHCLPAMRGQEVTAEVIDGPQSIVFDQAENRLHVEKAILLRMIGPAELPEQRPAPSDG